MIVVYVYLLISAFAGGYLLKEAIDDRDDDAIYPLTIVLISMIAPMIVVGLAVGWIKKRIDDRMER